MLAAKLEFLQFYMLTFQEMLASGANSAGADQDPTSAAYEEFLDSAGSSSAPAGENRGSNPGGRNMMGARELTMNVMRAMADVDGEDGENLL